MYRWPLVGESRSDINPQGSVEVLRVGMPQILSAPGTWAHAEMHSDPMGRSLIACDHAGGRAIVFRPDDPTKKLVLPHPKVTGCLVSPDGRWVCSSTRTDIEEVSVKVWDTSDGKLVWQLPVGEVLGYFTPDCRWLVTVPPGDAPLRLWETGSWRAGPTMPRHTAKHISMRSSPDGTIIIPAEQGSPRFIEAATGKELARFEAPRDFGGQAGARFSPDGAWLVSSTGNHTMHLWDLNAVRHGLIELGLDWDASSYRPPAAKADIQPIRLEIPDAVQDWAKADRKLARGYSLIQRGRFSEAVAEFEDATQLKPDAANTHAALAWLLTACPDPNCRDPQRALECARKAVALDSQAPLPWQSLGGALYRTGAWNECVAAMEQSIHLQKDGGGPGQWLVLAMAHSQMGNQELAAKWYDQGARWMETNEPTDELRRLSSEASALLAQ
jgi:hypothetical protein